MKYVRHLSSVFLLFALVSGTQILYSQSTATHPSQTEMEDFLLNAKIVEHKSLAMGVTNSERAVLSDGKLQHDAHIQTINESKTSFTSNRGTELNFKDTYKYNIAAYRLGKILDLNMIPVSIERKAAGKSAAVTWWVDDTMMTELDRKKKDLEPPDKDSWNKQMYVVRVFDQLIYNTDRNLGNLVIDKNWQIWMIDHTRAFRLMDKLQNEKNLVQCDRKFLASLRKLDEATMMAQLQPFLSKGEIKAILKRRDLIVKFFESEIAAKGEAAVVYDLPPRS